MRHKRILNSESAAPKVIAAALKGRQRHSAKSLPETMQKETIFALWSGKRCLHVGRSRNTRKYIRDNYRRRFGDFFWKVFRQNTLIPPTFDGGPLSRNSLRENAEFTAQFAQIHDLLRNASVTFYPVTGEIRQRLLVDAVGALLLRPYNPPT